MPRTKIYERLQDGEHVIEEANGLMSREQINLIPDVNGYKPGRVLALLTSGTNAGKWCKWDPNGTDGANTAKGVLFAGRKGSTGTIKAVAHVRDCDLNGKKMRVGPDGTTDAQKAAAFAQLQTRVPAGNYGGVRVRF